MACIQKCTACKCIEEIFRVMCKKGMVIDMKDKNRKKILVINGPNLNMLGIREPDIYGRETYQSLCDKITRYCESVGAEAELYQSNHEGDLVDKIQSAYGVFDGIIINPAHIPIQAWRCLMRLRQSEFRQLRFIYPMCHHERISVR